MANLGNVHANVLNYSDGGDFSSSYRVGQPYLLGTFYGNPLQAYHLIYDPNLLSDSPKSGLDSTEDGSDLDAKDIVACITSFARAYSNLGTTLDFYEECLTNYSI